MKIFIVMRQYNTNTIPICAYDNHTRAELVVKNYENNEPISYSPCRYYVVETELITI
jgi:hypothetical protein